jgi:hypothetical protein
VGFKEFKALSEWWPLSHRPHLPLPTGRDRKSFFAASTACHCPGQNEHIGAPNIVTAKRSVRAFAHEEIGEKAAAGDRVSPIGIDRRQFQIQYCWRFESRTDHFEIRHA